MTGSALHLLHLISEYPVVFFNSNVLERPQSKVWTPLVLQLFALLEHESFSIRLQVSSLLKRMSVDRPELLIPHAIVESGNVDAKYAREYCLDILNGIKLQSGSSIVEDTECVFAEFRRMTVLFDEKWFLKIGSLRHDLSRRADKLVSLCKRVSASSGIPAKMKRKLVLRYFAALAAPIVSTLERLVEETKTAQTPFEESFLDEYRQGIQEGIDSLRGKNQDSLKDAWVPFKEVLLLYNSCYLASFKVVKDCAKEPCFTTM
jgi:hypothetical protein